MKIAKSFVFVAIYVVANFFEMCVHCLSKLWMMLSISLVIFQNIFLVKA